MWEKPIGYVLICGREIFIVILTYYTVTVQGGRRTWEDTNKGHIIVKNNNEI